MKSYHIQFDRENNNEIYTFGGVIVTSSYLLNEQVKLLSDLPARIATDSRDALQVGARQAGNAAPGKRLLHLQQSENVKKSTKQLDLMSLLISRQTRLRKVCKT